MSRPRHWPINNQQYDVSSFRSDRKCTNLIQGCISDNREQKGTTMNMIHQSQKVCRQNLLMVLVQIIAITLLCLPRCKGQHHPTRVPGSEHLLVQTDFPYPFWKPSPRPYTPSVPPTPTTTPASYGYFYGDAIDDAAPDSSSWHMLPIQIPDDLVGAVNERKTVITTPSPKYPTSATPQYGQYPGVTEKPHLYYPERLYAHQHNSHSHEQNEPKNPLRHQNQYSHYENSEDNVISSHSLYNPQYANRPVKQKKPQTPWHQSLFDQLEPFMEAHIPKIPDLPKIPSINSISRLPTFPPWVIRNSNRDQEEESALSISDSDTPEYDTQEEQMHQFYPILYPAINRLRKNRRPGHHFSDSQQPIILSTPYNYDESASEDEQHIYPSAHLENTNHLPQNGNHDHPVEQNFLDNTLQYIRRQIRPMNIRRRPQRRRPGIRRKHIINQNPGLHRVPQRNYDDPPDDEYNDSIVPSQQQQLANDRHSVIAQPYVNSNNQPDTKLQPNIHNKRPLVRVHHRPDTVLRSPQISQYQPSHHQVHQETYQPISNVIPRPNTHHISQENDYDIIERLTDPLASGVSLPGGLLVVAFGLALFYFNFVWYPTPVVTARLIKLLSDSAPEDLLDTEKQKAIGEVYEVFRSLEAEYMQEEEVWQPSCKSRLVCQVHQELPGLWQVTSSYKTLMGISLATGPTGTEDLRAFLEAAQEGENGANCNGTYSTCPMDPIPMKASLQSLLGIKEDTNPTVIYS
ncbi:hypothetical protein SK128_010726 [Halocaridina rubra]|uniref:Uncharacterized protein n=1 Tax=Halocaridina rubra TaxID=373956 RepID=A0AAN8WIZ2_HALRR